MDLSTSADTFLVLKNSFAVGIFSDSAKLLKFSVEVCEPLAESRLLPLGQIRGAAVSPDSRCRP